MILQYKLKLLAFICFISGKTSQTYAKKLQTENQIKDTTVEKKEHHLTADIKHSTIAREIVPCCFPVHVPVKQPDVHELHVHIHEGNQCTNGGIMSTDSNGAFKCLCPPKYGGAFCEDTLYCYYNPCKNGGTCTEHIQGFKCNCAKGFIGHTCEERNFCKPNPCSHHSTCVETLNGFKCICEEGYKGNNCKDLDPCFPNPCKNNGICEDVKGNAKCDCPPTHKGAFCTETLVCFRNPCHHGGMCVENPTAPCVCKKGYIGIHCEDHVCKPNPCVNRGRCIIEGSLGHYKWTFNCACPRGFKGRLCHIPDPCVDLICLNGGTCIDRQSPANDSADLEAVHPHLLADFYCQCALGFTGKRCESRICDMCDVNAECVNNHCVCKENYVGNGFICTAIKDPCKPSPCKNNGSCVLGPDRSYTCNCVKGYCGPHCESFCDACVSNPCHNNGTCTVQGNSYVCTCYPGFTGLNCELTIPNPCNSQPCANGGTCIYEQSKNEYRCKCLGKYTGKNCEVCDCPKGQPTTQHPVALDQKCDLVGDCYCPEHNGWHTVYKEGIGCVEDSTLKVNPCNSNPCQNNGICRPVAVGVEALKYECICLEMYYGTNCECTECTCNNPCINGVCIDVAKHQFKCNCYKGFTGPTCGEIAPTVSPRSCSSTPCLNGGTCVDRATGSYDCICSPQYTGPHCGVDKCANCDVNADCVQGRCRCRKGYIGTGYVCVEDDKGKECGKEVVCPINQHCVRGFCICLPGVPC